MSALLRALSSTILVGCIFMLSLGCRAPPHTTIPLLRAAGVPLTPTTNPSIPLEVTTSSVGIPDPLPVDGASVAYSDIEGALGFAISSACVPWAEAHRDKRPKGFKLSIEIIAADARQEGSRMHVTFTTRATLRGRADNDYIAQTDVSCLEAGTVKPHDGGPVLYTCMTHLGRELAGWLGGVEP